MGTSDEPGAKYSPMAVVPDRRALYDFDWQGWGFSDAHRCSALYGRELSLASTHPCFTHGGWHDVPDAGVKPPDHHLKDLVIYETHVRGFTRILGLHGLRMAMQLVAIAHLLV